MDTLREVQKKDWSIFLSSVFFVLGFSTVFSLVGILLQTLLAHSSSTAQIWLGRVGGTIIILFGLLKMIYFFIMKILLNELMINISIKIYYQISIMKTPMVIKILGIGKK